MPKLLIQLLHKLIDKIGKEDKIMATLKEVQDSLAALKVTVETEHAEVKAAFDAAIKPLKDQIQALLDQIASGEVITATQLEELRAQVTAVETSVKSISDEVTVPPAPVPQPSA